jgi:copper chaperone CopZ
MYRITVLLLIIVVAFGFTSAQTTKTKTVTLAVTGLKCEMCVAKVDKALRGVDGVKDVNVSLEKNSAEVVLASTSVKSDVLLKAVADAGFAVSAGKLKMAAKKTEKESCDTDKMNKEVKVKKDGGPKEECCKDGKKDEAAKKDDCCKDKDTKKVETKN